MVERKPTRYEEIQTFFHCRTCIQELMDEAEIKNLRPSPAENARLEVGITEDGRLVVWCRRHDKLVGAWYVAERTT